MARLELLLLLIVLVGCASTQRTSTVTTTTSETQAPIVSDDPQIRTIHDYAEHLQTARDRFEEADVLRNLQRYLADHDLTFKVYGWRADNDQPVESGLSASTVPLRVRVDVFRGQQPLNNFTFVPRDNRNLTLLGQ